MYLTKVGHNSQILKVSLVGFPNRHTFGCQPTSKSKWVGQGFTRSSTICLDSNPFARGAANVTPSEYVVYLRKNAKLLIYYIYLSFEPLRKVSSRLQFCNKTLRRLSIFGATLHGSVLRQMVWGQNLQPGLHNICLQHQHVQDGKEKIS